jgi:hypothetical protein
MRHTDPRLNPLNILHISYRDIFVFITIYLIIVNANMIFHSRYL